MSCVLVLLMAIDVVVDVAPYEVPLPLLLYPRGASVTPCFRKILKFANIMHVTKIAIGNF
jgi:hypothetical protein